MNILVTGCSGFIGKAILEEYHSNLFGIDLSDIISDINFFKGDIRDSEFLEKVFANNSIDVVIHLAAKAGVRPSLLNPLEYVSTNVGGTVNILNYMQKYNVPKIVFASSSSVYGNSDILPFKEDMQNFVQISPYACSKKTAEEFIKTYSKLYGIKAVCLRFFTVYGPNQREDLAIHKFAKSILNEQPITMYGDGNSTRDYTYITDIVDGIKRAVEYDKTDFEIINLGSSHPIALKDMISTLEKALGKQAKIIQLPMQAGDVMNTYADISKAKELLGYEPKVSFEEGIRRFVESLKR